MNQYFGWTQGSQMPSTYVHMNGKEVDGAILAMNGIKTEHKTDITNKPIQCKRCDFINQGTATLCLRCSLPVNEKIAIELEEREQRRKKVDLLLNELIKQPEVQQLLLEKVQSLGLTKDIFS